MLFEKRCWRPGLILKVLFILLFLLILGIQAFSKEEIVYTDVKPQIVGATSEKPQEGGEQPEAKEKKAITFKEVSKQEQNKKADKQANVVDASTKAKVSKTAVEATVLAATHSSEKGISSEANQPRRRWIEGQTKTREIPTIIQEARTEVIPAEYRTEYYMACSVCQIELTNDTVNSHTEGHMLAGEGGGSYQTSRNVLVREEQVVQHEAAWGTKTEEYVVPGYWEYY
ncbi:ferredoxin [Aequitasia blattaphilus]|uniref:Uncharacterized protein n=2 Tax=Lachnospiraceae TaxID=186803 RepID=A0ABT1EFV1_9FIRM|nr:MULTISPECIES: hypothetical protein [Lachnospiraceae]MCP1100991.1 hypothetical protein [Aequitasia blattaphilus]MCP1109584.1 hypothetical protein [Ohessyouella blattaphilus]MCR8562978.1 hypothetical protein [Ohessyouella blattaphilus]MCR8613631.1 hypothetical protein [Aequitasia blattaphilus]